MRMCARMRGWSSSSRTVFLPSMPHACGEFYGAKIRSYCRELKRGKNRDLFFWLVLILNCLLFQMLEVTKLDVWGETKYCHRPRTAVAGQRSWDGFLTKLQVYPATLVTYLLCWPSMSKERYKSRPSKARNSISSKSSIQHNYYNNNNNNYCLTLVSTGPYFTSTSLLRMCYRPIYSIAYSQMSKNSSN